MRKSLLLLIAVFMGVNFHGQDLEHTQTFDRYEKMDVAPPEVISFEKVSLIPNDLSTGKLDFSIPIYTIKSGRLNYPIGLTYNSGGIKVDQQASEVGLGWSLSKTVITRKIIDGNDFNNVGNQFLDPEGGGFASGSEEASQHLKAEIKYVGYFLKKKENIKASTSFFRNVDEMPDIYNFITNSGFKTKFYFKDEGTPIELTENSSIINALKTKENYDNPIYQETSNSPYFPMYDFTKIEITSNEGIKYTFENFDVVINTSVNYPGLSAIYTYRSDSPQISTWHISKIEDLISGDQITFEYEQYNADPYEYTPVGPSDPPGLITYVSYRTLPWNTFLSSLGNCPGRAFGLFGSYNDKALGVSKSTVRHIIKNRLKEIKFKSGKVVFNWSGDREDLFKEKILSNISIYDTSSSTNQLVNRFQFTHEYFDSGCGDSYKCKRLKLKELEEKGKSPYKFHYDNEFENFPPIASKKEDYLGYNHSVIDITPDGTKMPNLYFYPNKQDKSILPFQIPNTANYFIPGDYNPASSLEDIRKWTLNKIEYPTGASTEIEYELNSINIFGQDVVASGLRVSSQIIKDQNNISRTINYDYALEDGKSSGTFVNIPIYGRPAIDFSSPSTDLSQWNANSLYNAFNTNQEPKIEADLTKGNYITYSRVIERESNGGYSVSRFISNDINGNGYERTEPTQEQLNSFTHQACGANSIINNSAYGLSFYTDNSFKRGQLIDKKFFDQNARLKKEIINHYSENEDLDTDRYTKRFFQLRRRSDGGSQLHDYENIIDVSKSYVKNTFKLRSTTTVDYTDNGIISTDKHYDYNDIGMLSSIRSEIDANKTATEKYTYANDIRYQEYGLLKLLETNYLSYLIESEKIVETPNDQFYIEGKRKELNPDTTIRKLMNRYSGSDPYEEYLSYDSYLNHKPTQARDRSGKITSFVWSGDFLIAKIENETYSNVKNTAMNVYGIDIENCSSSNCQPLFENLRTHYPSSKITSFSYLNPLIGVTSITDARGATVYYEYDDFNRLVRVKDQDGNVVTEHAYNYKNNN